MAPTTSPILISNFNPTGPMPMSKDVITYDVIVKDQYHSKAFSFVHRVPEALYQDWSNRSAMVAFMDSLVKEHHQELVEAHPWKCVVCQQPATSLARKPQSKLHMKDNPSIVESATPICVDDSRCHVIIHNEMCKWVAGLARNVDIMQKLFTEVFGAMDNMRSENKNTCEHCCKTSKAELKRCGRCKNVSYCSRDCQVAHWPKHNIDCTKNESK